MAEFDDKIAQLQARLENLVRTQIGFQQEITQIRSELNFLRGASQKQNVPEPPRKPPVREYIPPSRNETPPITQETNQQSNQQAKAPNFGYSTSSTDAKPPYENTVRPFPVKQK
jgi:hypothetical protein